MWKSRVTASLLVVAAHVAALYLWKGTPLRRPDFDVTSVLLILPDTHIERIRPSQPDRELSLQPPSMKIAPLPYPSPVIDNDSRAITEESKNADSDPRPIDWRQQADQVARELAEEDSAAPKEKKQPSSAVRQPWVGWSPSRTNRIQQTQDGNTIVWITDKCYLVNFLLPTCLFGEVPARGDLFDHMQEPPELGDWKN